MSITVIYPYILLAFIVTAQSNDWKVLAKKEVAYKHKKDMISLSGSEKDIRKFKNQCTQRTSKFKKIVIYYNDNTEFKKTKWHWSYL